VPHCALHRHHTALCHSLQPRRPTPPIRAAAPRPAPAAPPSRVSCSSRALPRGPTPAASLRRPLRHALPRGPAPAAALASPPPCPPAPHCTNLATAVPHRPCTSRAAPPPRRPTTSSRRAPSCRTRPCSSALAPCHSCRSSRRAATLAPGAPRAQVISS
jgi:hypothetical protein